MAQDTELTYDEVLRIATSCGLGYANALLLYEALTGGGGSGTATDSIKIGSQPGVNTANWVTGPWQDKQVTLAVHATPVAKTMETSLVWVVDNGTYNATAADCTSRGLEISLQGTRSAGANNLVNHAIIANATGGQTNYSFFSSNGQMVQTGDAHFGNLDITGNASVTGTFGAGTTSLGATSIGGQATIGTAPTGQTHTVNGNWNVRSDAVDTWVNIRNLSTGGRDYFIEASGNGGTDPNCLAIYDNTAGATRFKINSSGHVTANVKLGVGGSLWASGTGSPEGVVTGNKGDIWSRTDGGAATCFYVKETTGGNTGWVAK